MDDERSDKDETDESEDEDVGGEDKSSVKKNGPVQNGHAVHNNNHSKTEWQRVLFGQKDRSRTHIGVLGGGGFGGGVLELGGAVSVKPKTAGSLKKVNTVTHTNTQSHTSMYTRPGHGQNKMTVMYTTL